MASWKTELSPSKGIFNPFPAHSEQSLSLVNRKDQEGRRGGNYSCDHMKCMCLIKTQARHFLIDIIQDCRFKFWIKFQFYVNRTKINQGKGPIKVYPSRNKEEVQTEAK